MLRWMLSALLISCNAPPSTSLKGAPPQRRHSLKATLQKCYEPKDVLHLLANDLTIDNDPHGTVSSLCLVRLSKQLIAIDNQCRHDGQIDDEWKAKLVQERKAWSTVSQTLGKAICAVVDDNNKASVLESHIEGIKSMSVLSRIMPEIGHVWEPTLEALEHEAHRISPELQPHQLSGLHWAYDCLNLVVPTCPLPFAIRDAHDNLELPFRIRPGYLASIPNYSVDTLVAQANFQVDAIRTTATNQVVRERRQTVWEGDDGVAPFAYSGKSMDTNPWSPLVQTVRDSLAERTGIYYDGCLLNLYPDGGSGMRYHADPDQGVLWDYETAVVSLGATRRFSFRTISSDQQQPQPHTFVLMDGDVTEMFDDCQSLFQHTVRTADVKQDDSRRASLVFKRTLTT